MGLLNALFLHFLMNMKRCFLLLFSLVSFPLWAAVLPAEKLLPHDTLFLLTTPDAIKLRGIFTNSPQMQMWRDAAMKPFRDNFMKKFSADMIEPLEKELGIKFADYKDLAQGQFTFAIVQNGWQGKPDEKLAMVLLLDTKDKKDVLKTNLSKLQKKWVDSGKEMKTEKIRDVEFTTILTSEAEMNKTLENLTPGNSDEKVPEYDEKPNTNKIEILIGQADSLLIVGNVKAVIEKILAKQAGGLSPSIAEDGVYEANHNMLFRDAHASAWLNLKPILEVVKSTNAVPEMAGLATGKAFTALGLNGLTSVAAAYKDSPDGSVMNVFLGAPEATRQGIVKMMVAEAKDSAPPSFVPAETVKFSRWRIDLQKALNGLESMMTSISPAYAGVFKLIFESAGKDQDPSFDLRKELIGNLGNDLITYGKKPRGATVAELESPPSIYLLSSPNAEKLAHALKIGMSSLSLDPSLFKDREFLGRKIYSVSAPPPPGGAPSAAPPKSLHFAASGGYVGLSTDVSILEEYIRSSETKPKPLSESPGMAEASQRIGGTSTGLFAYENQAEIVRVAFEGLKKDPSQLSALFGVGAVGQNLTPGDQKKQKEWVDASLLPSFDAVAKYFYFTVYTGTVDANGFMFKIFAPTPPALKK